MSDKRQLFLPVILVLLICSLALSGCDYKKFTLKEGIAHFSFEYPSHYYLENISLGDLYTGPRTTINLYTEPLEDPIFHEAIIWIYIDKSGEKYSDANADESLESYISFWSRDKDFLLIERSGVTVAGVQGTQIVYSHISYLIEDVHYGTHLVKTPAIVRIIFFDYDVKVWRISIEGHESLEDTLKADFEHILDTFKILE